MYDVGTFVDRYQVERVIGNDAVAVVYGVRHTMLGSRHALKLLTRNSQAADKALQGARDQATLHHPHVVAITDILHVASRVGLVMELVEGGSLEARLANERPALDEALQIFRGIVRGVRHAHEHRILHGGLAMRRVLLDRTNGRVVPKVTGFGVEGAIAAGPDALDDVSRIAGLPPRLDTDADLTQLGVLLYELLTGRRASAGSHPDPRTLVPSIPEDVALLANALVHGERGPVGTCQAILERLDSFLDDRELAPTRPVTRRAAPPIAALASAEPLGEYAQLESSDGEDVDTDATTDPGASSSSGGAGVAAVAMAGEGIGPLPPPMPRVGEDDDEDDSSPVPLRADRSLPPDDSLPRIERPRRRPARWLVASVLVLAPILGLLAAYQTRESRSEPAPSPIPAPVATIAETPVEALPEQSAEPAIAEPPPVAPVEEAAPVPESEPIAAVAAVVPETAPPAEAPAKPPAPKASAEPKPNGTIRLEGDASQIWIELAGGWVSPGGSVPPGTYRVKALFGGPEPIRAGSVTVKSGKETVLRCSATETECR
jgi:hypothetical protein